MAGRWKQYQQQQKQREEERREAEAEQQRRREAQAARESAHGESHGGRAGATPGGAPAGEGAARATAARDEAAWQRFVQMVDRQSEQNLISMSDVPWPALEAGALGLDRHLTSAAERKQAFRAASLRWHPDKFMQSFGSRLRQEEHDAILQRVTEVSQAINALYQAAES